MHREKTVVGRFARRLAPVSMGRCRNHGRILHARRFRRALLPFPLPAAGLPRSPANRPPARASATCFTAPAASGLAFRRIGLICVYAAVRRFGSRKQDWPHLATALAHITPRPWRLFLRLPSRSTPFSHVGGHAHCPTPSARAAAAGWACLTRPTTRCWTGLRCDQSWALADRGPAALMSWVCDGDG